MKTVKATYEIARMNAVLAGKNQYGIIEIELDAAELSSELREELTKCPIDREERYILDGHMGGRYYDWHELGEPRETAVTEILQARVQMRKKIEWDKAAEQAAAELAAQAEQAEMEEFELRLREPTKHNFVLGDGQTLRMSAEFNDFFKHHQISKMAIAVALRDDVARLRREADEAAQDAANAAAAKKESERRQAWAEFIRSHGEVDQLVRFYNRVLPRTEMYDLAMRVLFAAFDCCNRYQKLSKDDIDHTTECYEGSECAKFATRTVATVTTTANEQKNQNVCPIELILQDDLQDDLELTKEQYSKINDIIDLTRGANRDLHYTVSIRRHRAWCDCDAEIYRLGLSIATDFADETFKLELEL